MGGSWGLLTGRCVPVLVMSIAAPLLFAASAPASTAPKAITGSLSSPGYTVMALASNGEASTVIAPAGGFRLVPPAETVTLHLRAPDGTYAGPIAIKETRYAVKQAKANLGKAKRAVTKSKRAVTSAKRKLRKADGKQARKTAKKRLAKATKRLRKANRRLKNARRDLRAARRDAAEAPERAILGVKAGAPLGQIGVDSAAGYALAYGLRGEASQTFVESAVTARANGDVPIGAGKFGLVQSSPAPGAVVGDLDLDGIPDILDIDTDGDLIVDNIDRPSAARATRSSQAANYYEQFPQTSELRLHMNETVNANAAALTVQDIDTALATFGVLILAGVPSDDPAATEFDCGGTPNPTPPPPLVGGLTYCSWGGTGSVGFGPARQPGSPAFPDCCDADDDGFGTLAPATPNPFMFLAHGATTDQIQAGDVIVTRAPVGGVEGEYPAVLGLVFSTVPALVSYTDSAGNSASVSYPVAPNGPGTPSNPFPVAPGPDGDIVLTFTVWRPQRKPIATETGPWIDIGGLKYHPLITSAGPGPSNINCPQDSLSTDDPALSADPLPFGSGGAFKDGSADQRAAPANTLRYSVNVTDCLASKGGSWDPGETAEFQLIATTGSDRAVQILSFVRP
jgi:hypothetical protein